MSAQCPYTIECIYSANRCKYQGTGEYLLAKTCHNHCINLEIHQTSLPLNEWESGKSDTNFELRCGMISKYLAIQKIDNKSLSALLIFIILLNRIKRFWGTRLMGFRG